MTKMQNVWKILDTFEQRIKLSEEGVSTLLNNDKEYKRVNEFLLHVLLQHGLIIPEKTPDGKCIYKLVPPKLPTHEVQNPSPMPPVPK